MGRNNALFEFIGLYCIKFICCVIIEKDIEKCKYLLLILIVFFIDSGKVVYENGGIKRWECGSYLGVEID